jgi:hypothetical protein
MALAAITATMSAATASSRIVLLRAPPVVLIIIVSFSLICRVLCLTSRFY